MPSYFDKSKEIKLYAELYIPYTPYLLNFNPQKRVTKHTLYTRTGLSLNIDRSIFNIEFIIGYFFSRSQTVL